MHAPPTPAPVTQSVIETSAAEPTEAVMQLPRTSPVILSKAIPLTPPTDVLIRRHGEVPTKQPPTGPGNTYQGRPRPQAATQAKGDTHLNTTTNQGPACEHPAHGANAEGAPATPVGVAFMAPPPESFDYDEELRAAIALSLEGEDPPDAGCPGLLPALDTTNPAASGTSTQRPIRQEEARQTSHEYPTTTSQVVKTPTRELIGWVASAGRSEAKEKDKQDPPRSRNAIAWTRFSVKLLFGLERDDGTAAPSVIDTEAMD